MTIETPATRSSITYAIAVASGRETLYATRVGADLGWDTRFAELQDEADRDAAVAEAMAAGLPCDVVRLTTTHYATGRRRSEAEHIGGTATIIDVVRLTSR